MGTDTPTSTEGHGAAKELYFLECGGILEAVGRLGFVESVWIMGRYAWLKKLGQSLLRIAVALSVLLGIPALLYWLWTPGIAEAAGKFDQGQNAVWLGHGWLGDDSWFERNSREPELFRSSGKLTELMRQLQSQHIRFVYPHLCPAQFNGAIAPYDDAQMERFLDAAQEFGIEVIPWIGGVLGESARLENRRWRDGFAASVKELLEKHPRLAGVQVNIEPLPSGNSDFLLLLDELRPVLKGRILGVAAYPPPTRWHPHADVHWALPYLAEVAKRSDQMAVMMYDTAIKLEKFYIRLMTQWTRELQEMSTGGNCKLLLGVPAYEDAGSGYHHPEVENLTSALAGIQAAEPGGNYIGCAIYCEWEMTPEKWRIWNSHFLPQL